MASSKILTLSFILICTLHFSISSSSHVSLSVSPKTLTKSNNTVRIQWSNIETPSDLDFVAIYSPPSSADKEFIGYLFLNSSPTYLAGSGSISLPLTNTRSNYQFRIFHWTRSEIDHKHHDHDRNPLPVTKHKLAVSEEVKFENALGPDQVHLAFTDRVDEMRVLFVMGNRLEGRVRYGLEMGRLGTEVGTDVRRYERMDMCDFPANSSIGWRDPGWIHDGVMNGLESGRKYYYQVGSDAHGWSPVYSFISRDNNANETIAFLFGDMGTAVPYATFYRAQDESRSTVKWILRDIESLGDKPAFVSHIGDISYARGFSWMWDEFFNQVEPIASRVPYHVCIGNHEYDWPLQPWKPSWSYGVYGTDGGGECGIPYSLRFTMPGNSSVPTGTGAPDTRNLYYSFDVGVVHFLYFSTETNFLKGSDQHNFIKADLERVNRDKTPFIVVQGHRPMYTTSNELRDAPMRARMLEHLEPLLVENNVTLALWGHVHRYERFCPIRNYTCADVSSNYGGSTVHVVIGMAGQDWQPIWEPRPDHTDVPIFPQPTRSMYRGGEFGYTKLVATREKLTLAYIGNHDGKMHDMVEIWSGLTQDVVEISSGLTRDTVGSEVGSKVVAKSIPTYVMGAIVLMLGAVIGYFIGLLSRCRRVTAPRNTWTPVKSEEI